jgi:hypothetical protein
MGWTLSERPAPLAARPVEAGRCERSHFVTPERMSAGGAVLDPSDVEDGRAEFDFIPTQVAQFGRSQPVPEGNQDHGGVPMSVPVRFGCLDQGFDFTSLATAAQHSPS